MKIGDRVNTCKGAGVIVNRERANNAVPPRVQMVSTGRYGVKLDDAAMFPWYKDGIAYFQLHELKPL